MEYETLVDTLASTLAKTMAKTLLDTLADSLAKLQAKQIGETLSAKLKQIDSSAECFDANFKQQDCCARSLRQVLVF